MTTPRIDDVALWDKRIPEDGRDRDMTMHIVVCPGDRPCNGLTPMTTEMWDVVCDLFRRGHDVSIRLAGKDWSNTPMYFSTDPLMDAVDIDLELWRRDRFPILAPSTRVGIVVWSRPCDVGAWLIESRHHGEDDTTSMTCDTLDEATSNMVVLLRRNGLQMLKVTRCAS